LTPVVPCGLFAPGCPEEPDVPAARDSPALVLGALIAHPSVNYAVTAPGEYGAGVPSRRALRQSSSGRPGVLMSACG